MAAETAARLTVGEVMPNFTYDTPFATALTLSDTVQKTSKTALLFLRYYGCIVRTKEAGTDLRYGVDFEHGIPDLLRQTGII